MQKVLGELLELRVITTPAFF